MTVYMIYSSKNGSASRLLYFVFKYLNIVELYGSFFQNSNCNVIVVFHQHSSVCYHGYNSLRLVKM